MWVLRWGDVDPSSPVGVHARPNRRIDGDGPNPGPPWVRMDTAAIARAIADTDAAWKAWQESKPPPPRAPVIELRSPDGARWAIEVDDAGGITTRKVQ